MPCFLISPFARRRHLSHATLDHTSILRMIEWRWGLEPLTVRDATAANLAEALDFSARLRRAPRYHMPAGSFGAPCATVSEPDKWLTLLGLARDYGWAI